MKTWRVLGLVWASLVVAFANGCGDSGGADKEDASSPIEEELDGDLDAGEDPPEDAPDDPEDIDSGTTEDVDSGVTEDIDACEPKGCKELGFTCGTPEDGCGGPLSCGTCTGGLTCGGGGEPFKCGCAPATCEQLSSERGTKVCGMIADGCGGMLDCGNTCTGTDTCGGGAAPNQCGCTPNPAACVGKECGTASDGCGNTVQCGSNAGMCSAARTCTAGQTCACKPSAELCNGRCGPIVEGDCAVDCGACTTTCSSQAACGSCRCPAAGDPASTADDEICRAGTCCLPEPVATTCGTALCGTKINNCGQTVSCGTCGSGLACSSQSRCEPPAVAALVGKYAVRSVGFAKALSIVTRAEGLLLVDISRDATGKLMMHEQSCWSGAFTRKSASVESTVSTTAPAVSANLPATTIELDLASTQTLPGAKEWLRGVQPANQNTGGWRRGRPTYCPANGGAADPALPGYGPVGGGTRALGARKPWLGGGVCNCPAQEFALHPPCQGLTGAKLTACMADPENLSMPYQPGSESADSTVTDCRVVDDDLDGSPGVTADVTAEITVVITLRGEAIVRSASVTSNVFWGKIDTSGGRAHWGVSQDQPELQSANVACQPKVDNAASNLLCSTGSATICPGYQPGQTADKEHRVNPIDFVPIDNKAAPAGGWTCEAIFARRAEWFPDGSWPSRYPSSDTCR